MLFGQCHCRCGWNSGHDSTNIHGSQNTFVSHNAFQSLSEDEKNAVYSDIYGVGTDIVEETPELINVKLSEVRCALDKIPSHKRQGYTMALKEEARQGTDYVMSTKFLLMFLRAERFRVAPAAKRIAKHFDHKMELFSVEQLPHPITQADLTPEDLETLFCGFFYICHNMDHFGRTVLFCNTSKLVCRDMKTLFRIIFYYGVAMVQDNDDAQRMGIIYVPYCIEDGLTELQKKQLVKFVNESSCFGSAPYRIASYHHCESAEKKSTYIFFTQMLFSLYFRSIKARYRQHRGSHKQVHTELLQFGIRVEKLPVTASGKVDETTFMEPLHKLKKKEEQRKRLLQDDQDYSSNCQNHGDDNSMKTSSYDDEEDGWSLGSY